MNRIRNINGRRLLYAIAIVAVMLIAVAPLIASAANNRVNITVRQNFSAPPQSETGLFTYVLKPLGNGYPMPTGNQKNLYEFSIAGNKSFEIGPIVFNQQGNFKYEVYQVVDNAKPGYVYDRQVYTVEVRVNANLEVEITIKNSSGVKVTGIVFDNYVELLATDPKLMADPPVMKTVSGHPKTAGTFTFALTALDPKNPMPAGSSNGVKKIQITGSGSGEFGQWSYNRAGVYYYTITEENTGESGYKYDAAVYTITDTVTGGANGQLTLSRVVTNKSNRTVTNCAFINKYSAGIGQLFDDTTEELPGIGPDGSSLYDANNPFGSGNVKGAADTEVKDYTASNTAQNNAGGSSNYRGYSAGYGPKTGDDRNTAQYLALLIIGGALATAASFYLVAAEKKRKEKNRAI